MALDDLLISTGVDNLIKLVHEKGRIELRAAAAAMALPDCWSATIGKGLPGRRCASR